MMPIFAVGPGPPPPSTWYDGGLYAIRSMGTTGFGLMPSVDNRKRGCLMGLIALGPRNGCAVRIAGTEDSAQPRHHSMRLIFAFKLSYDTIDIAGQSDIVSTP
ncbi:hypothetical protein Trydic_g20072 [Trypoxylus dichotomus]